MKFKALLFKVKEFFAPLPLEFWDMADDYQGEHMVSYDIDAVIEGLALAEAEEFTENYVLTVDYQNSVYDQTAIHLSQK